MPLMHLKASLTASRPREREREKKERYWTTRHVTLRSTSVGRRAALASDVVFFCDNKEMLVLMNRNYGCFYTNQETCDI